MYRLLTALAAVLVFTTGLRAQEKPVTAPGTPETATIKKAAEKAFKDQNWADAAKNYRELIKSDPANGPAWHRLGYSLHAEGKLDEALEAHKKAYEISSVKALGAYNAACVYALKNNKDEAFAWLDKAVAAGFSQAETLENDTDMDNLRADPRFKDIAAKIAKVAETSTTVQAFNQTNTRGSSRVAFFGGKGGAGQIIVDYGTPGWKADYDKKIDDPGFQGKRWRLGSDSWTHFDTMLDIEVGTAKLTPGDYYLTIERSKAGDFVLAFLDPKEIRRQRLDAFQADKTTGGITTSLKHEKVADIAKELTITVTTNEGENSKGVLTIHFGPHKLTAPLTIKMS